MTSLYKEESRNPKYNAQRNLSGRSHYVDEDTLRFHKSRILNTYVVDGGLIFALIESCAADMHNTKRIYRPVIFDVFGTVIDRPSLTDGFKTSKQAVNAMWELLNSINAIEITQKGIANHRAQCEREIKYLEGNIAQLVQDNKITA